MHFQTAQQGDPKWLAAYRLAVISWIIIGISYWAVIIAFVTKALKVTCQCRAVKTNNNNFAKLVEKIEEAMAENDRIHRPSRRRVEEYD